MLISLSHPFEIAKHLGSEHGKFMDNQYKTSQNVTKPVHQHSYTSFPEDAPNPQLLLLPVYSSKFGYLSPQLLVGQK